MKNAIHRATIAHDNNFYDMAQQLICNTKAGG